MNDPEVITAVKASYAGIHMDVPLDVIVRRGGGSGRGAVSPAWPGRPGRLPRWR